MCSVSSLLLCHPLFPHYDPFLDTSSRWIYANPAGKALRIVGIILWYPPMREGYSHVPTVFSIATLVRVVEYHTQ